MRVKLGLGPAWVGINRLSGKAQCLWLIDPVYADKDGKSPDMALLAATSRSLGGFWFTTRTSPTDSAAAPSTRVRARIAIPGTGAELALGLMGSVAEFERSIIKERQAEGIARAKARGAYKGRAKVLTDAQVSQARQWVADGVPKAEVARRLGIGRTTLCKYLERKS